MKSINIEGFKSFFGAQKIALGPITIFAGANSSGKSSALQPLLLLKQTIECQYDPGALLLEGPNLRFTSMEQMLSKRSGETQHASFSIRLDVDDDLSLSITYSRGNHGGAAVKSVTLSGTDGRAVTYNEHKKFNEAERNLLFSLLPATRELDSRFSQDSRFKTLMDATSGRCFPDIRLAMEFGDAGNATAVDLHRPAFQDKLRKKIEEIIHIQGLRGNPERTYSSTAKVSKRFPGLFTDYVASVLQRWQDSSDRRLEQIGTDLRRLGLSWKVRTQQIHDTKVEIRVSRLPNSTQGGAHDLVNLADVGLGVSQVLPLLVALRVAKRGQIIFVEQPEIHLHPKAQHALVDIIIEAEKRGVLIWIETHSSSLLRGFQTKVAQGEIRSDSLALNWFSRDTSSGATQVSAAQVTELGQYGSWPIDFDEVSLGIEKQYLDAVSKKAFPAREIKGG